MHVATWFVPSRKNKHHPHLIRPAGLAVILALILLSNLVYNVSEAKKFQVLGYATSITPAEVTALSNGHRISNGLNPYQTNTQLTSAAQAKANDMFAKQYWAHTSPDGKGPAYFINNSGYVYITAGENLAKDFNTSLGVVNGWMNSPSHRANVLSSKFIDTGVAVVNGVLNGNETTIVVAMYGQPASSPAPAPAPSPAPTSPKQSPTPSVPKQTPAAPAPEQEQPVVEDPVNEPDNAPEITEETSVEDEEYKVAPIQTLEEVQISAREELNWAQSTSLFLLSAVLIVNVLKHTAVWRTNKRGLRHIWFRSHPLAQYALITFALIAIFTSSSGVIK